LQPDEKISIVILEAAFIIIPTTITLTMIMIMIIFVIITTSWVAKHRTNTNIHTITNTTTSTTTATSTTTIMDLIVALTRAASSTTLIINLPTTQATLYYFFQIFHYSLTHAREETSLNHKSTFL
jgi:hypothetical protein